jgi:hypothetical protein
MSGGRRPTLRAALVEVSLGALLGATWLALGPASSAPSAVSHERRATGDEALSLALKGMSGTEVRSASLMEAPADSPTTGPWVSVQVNSNKGDDLYAVWLAGLVRGAVVDRMWDDEESTADVVGGGQLEDTDRTGAAVVTPLGTGSVVGGQVFHSPSDDDLEARAEAAARRFGLELLTVQVMHPLETAIAVRFALPGDGELTWTIDDLRAAVAGSPLSVEGVFIEIVSPSGKSLLRTGASYRTGEGGLSFARGQDDRFGAVHGHLGSLSAVK